MTTTVYPLSELRAALRELDAGTYTHPATSSDFAPGLDRLDCGVVAVLGVSGGVGATIVGLAIAETIGADRLIELCPAWGSGLVEATTAELGHDRGWRLGNRGALLIERRESDAAGLRDVPGRAVVDAGAWIGGTPALLPHIAALVVVAPCTIPGIRRLELLLSLSPTDALIIPVLVGATTPKAMPRSVVGAAGPLMRAGIQGRRVATVPVCPSLRRTGITGDKLPKALLVAAATLAHHLKDVLP
ncbi:hypothetical protein [Tessaracoccus antarcticus]|uniref:Uncharacterized protein n=1 Tax=Tessaracoccus antarcticus TaxID=2479848 RepID=A0A3M0G826_9ACTN|nr:hypothetical protein [Tessaracoccus antarcticus]RMB57843.1 hypothetical protein EAX62_15425 [Tessaracoccus antarcticus]